MHSKEHTEVVVCELPDAQFPPGSAYFAEPSSGQAHAVVVHNNFIGGGAAKLARFREVGLWANATLKLS